MREYLALQNAEKVAQQTGSNKVILAYGITHAFTDVQAACFPHITLRTLDMSNSDKADVSSQKFIYDLLSQRPLVNCSNLALGSNMPLPISANNNAVASASPDYVTQCGAIALVGLVAFGLFRYCLSRKQSKVSQQTSVNDDQADQQKTIATSNRSQSQKYKRA